MAKVPCPHCGFRNIEARSTCKQCGESLDAPTTVQTTAPQTETPPASSPAKGQYKEYKGNYEYLVVPFVGHLKRGVVTIETAQKVSDQLQDLINRHAAQGWEFYRVDKVDIEVSPGCLAILFGRRTTFLTFDQVVFRRLVPGNE